LDDAIRATLRAEVERTPSTAALLKSVLQQAQTQVEQLPPALVYSNTPTELELNGSPAAALMTTPPHSTHDFATHGGRIATRMADYRYLIDMQLLRALGTAHLALNITR
jgi:hypothetical protein